MFMLLCINNFMSKKKTKNKNEIRESMFAIRLSKDEMRVFKRLCNILEMNKSEMVRFLVTREFDKLKKQIGMEFK